MPRVDTGYTDAGALNGDEKFFLVDDPSGTPGSRNSTPSAIRTYLLANIDADDISVTGTTNKFTTAADITKLAGIETGADVTDATNVDAAGATMNTDTDVSANSWVLDEDTMVSDSATKLPTQQSVKAYVDSRASVTETLTNKTIIGSTNEVEADRVMVDVRNESGATLTAGTPVYISGYSVGQNVILVSAADASTLATADTLGLIETDLANNATGLAITAGMLSGVDTSAFTAGDRLYLSETAGALTTTRPTGTAIVQSIGEVLRSHATLGVIEVERSQSYKTGYAAELLLDGTAADARSHLGVVIGTDVQAHSAVLDATTASFTTADETKLDGIEALADVTDATNVAAAGAHMSGGTDVPVADGGTGASTAAGARTNLGLVIGTDVQAYDAELAAIAGLTSAADKLPYFTGSGTAAVADFTSAARSEIAALAVPQTVTGTTDTLAAADARRLTMYSNAAAVTVTVPTGTFSAGDWFLLQSTGAGGVTLSTTGITLNGSAPNKTIAQNEGMLVIFTAANTISILGATAA